MLRKFDSAFLPVRRGDVWLSSLYGSWANEGRLVQEPLEPGMKVIKNRDGVRNSHTAHAEVMFSLDGKPQENYGNVMQLFVMAETTNCALIRTIVNITSFMPA